MSGIAASSCRNGFRVDVIVSQSVRRLRRPVLLRRLLELGLTIERMHVVARRPDLADRDDGAALGLDLLATEDHRAFGQPQL